MDEYLSEKEQFERIRQWWADNGWYLVGGVVLGLLGIYGYIWYGDYRTGRAEQAADLYQQIVVAVDEDDVDAMDGALAELRDAHADSPYTDQGGLLVARHFVVTDSARAAGELRTVMESAQAEELAMIARLRLARVLSYRGEYDEALALLSVDEPGIYAARIGEIEGDIHAARGNDDAALIAYTTALSSEGAELIDRNFVQMKLAGVIEPPPAEEAEPAPAEEPGVAAE